MKSLRIRLLVIDLITALFVVLFLYTALMKLKDVSRFEGNMLHSPSIAEYAHILSWAVPMAELLAVLLLIIPRLRLAGLIFSTLLMMLFTIYTGYILSDGSPLPCTCGGIIEKMGWRAHFLFNSGFFILGLTAIILHHKIIAITRRSRTPAI